MIDKYILVYLDDILVYSENSTKHKEHLMVCNVVD